MALITCPECGGQVSDRASVCIHCGYPLNQNVNTPKQSFYSAIYNNILDQSTYNANKIKAIGYIRPITGLGLADAKTLIENPPQTIKTGIPKADADKIAAQMKKFGCGVEVVEATEQDESWDNEVLSAVDRKPHCPTCGSTNIKQISFTRKAVGVATLGIFSKSARSQFQCKDCGYKW